MSANIHDGKKFGKLIPRRFRDDVKQNGDRKVNNEEELDFFHGKERQRRRNCEKKMVEAGEQYGKYSGLIGFGPWVRRVSCSIILSEAGL